MMRTLLFDPQGQLCGVFESADAAREVQKNHPHLLSVQEECRESTVIDCKRFYDLWDLYRVELQNGEHMLFYAPGLGAAAVDALLIRAACGAPNCEIRRIFEYRIARKNYGNVMQIPTKEYPLYPPAQRLLTHLCEDNKDLCAHALELINGFRTEEEIWEQELLCNTTTTEIGPGSAFVANYQGIQSLNSSQLKRRSILRFDYFYTEEQDMNLRQMNLLYGCRDLEDGEAALFWSFIFELWGGYDCNFPYALYRGILNNSFARFYEDYRQKRKLLTGEV